MTPQPESPEPLKVVAWTEAQTMAAIRTTASHGTVTLTREYGPYDIDRPTFQCDRLVEAIVTARDAQWQAARNEAEAMRADAARWRSMESAPTSGELVLLCCVGWPPASMRGEPWPIKVGGQWKGRWEIFGASWAPTHWMPLPKGPEDAECSRSGG